MKQAQYINTGGLLIEAMLSVVLLLIFLSGAIFLLVENAHAIVQNQNFETARSIAQETIDAMYSIRNKDWCALKESDYNVMNEGNTWSLVPGKYLVYRNGKLFRRWVAIEDVYRDGNGNLVAAGSGLRDADTKKITIHVYWKRYADNSMISIFCTTNPQDPSCNLNTLIYTTYLTRQGALVPNTSGMLVFNDFSSRTYRLYDASDNIWGEKNTDWYPAVEYLDYLENAIDQKIYRSSTRDEKILLSHSGVYSYNRNQRAYIHTCNTWVNAQQLPNYHYYSGYLIEGTYLDNGDFMAVYSLSYGKNLRYRIWNGQSWSSEMLLPALSAEPYSFVLRHRSGTNEVMLAALARDAVWRGNPKQYTETMYFNYTSGEYSSSNWTLHTTHATRSSLEKVDFQWMTSNLTHGLLLYTDNQNDKNVSAKMWIVDNFGNGNWGAAIDSDDVSEVIRAVKILPYPNSDTLITCYQEEQPSGVITCNALDDNPLWLTVYNGVIGSTNDSSGEQFDLALEGLPSHDLIIVYADASTGKAQLKKYTINTATWDAVSTPLDAALPSPLTTHLVPNPDNKDIMLFLTAADGSLYSHVWNGDTNTFYSTSDGRGLTRHRTNVNQSSYDFTW